MPDFKKRAKLAAEIAADQLYETEFVKDDDLLTDLYEKGIGRIPGEDLSGVHRYLVIATENAGQGPGDDSGFFESKAEAETRMGEFVRQGWSCSLWDLDYGSLASIEDGSPEWK